MSYKLVNPHIVGDFSITFKDSSPANAANKCWKQLSKLLSNDVPSFAFTLKNIDTGDYHHFKVKEDKNNDKINYTIKEMLIKLTPDQLQTLDNLGMKDSKEGGRRHRHKYNDDDDDSSSSSSFLYNKYKSYPITPMMPINYWYYYPALYTLSYVYIPTFIAPITPYVKICI